MKKAISILLVVCLAVMLPLTALADGASVAIKDNSYTWNGQKVVKPVFSGDKAVAKKLNEVMDDTYREFQFIGQRATDYAKKPEVVIDYTVYYNAEGLLSMSVDMSIMNPVGSYASEVKYFILFDLATGGVIHWEDIIDEEAKDTAFLLDLFNYGVNLTEGWDAENVIEELPPFDAFYFDGESLTAVYAVGLIDDESSYAFSLPLGALAGMAKDTALKSFIDAAEEFVPPSAEEDTAESDEPKAELPIFAQSGIVLNEHGWPFVYAVSYTTAGILY